MLADILPTQMDNPKLPKFSEFVSPAGLVAYGIMANALFWCGLLLPYNANAELHVAYLHGFVVLMGVALAFGGAVATLMIVTHKISVPYYSLEFASGLLNIFVLTTSGTLVMHALIRGL